MYINAYMSKFFISIDQGTTSSRAVLYNSSFDQLSQEQKEFKQYYPAEGLVEHDPEEIWRSVFETTKSVSYTHLTLPTICSV